MKYLKKFNENKISNDISLDSLKEEMIVRIDDLLEIYNDFTKRVSPKHWRLTGNHFTELKKMKDDILRFTEITDKEKETYKKFLVENVVNVDDVEKLSDYLSELETKLISKEAPDTGFSMTYTIADDSARIDFNWSDFEDADGITLKIEFKDKIYVDKHEEGYHPSEGEYKNDTELEFGDVNELIDYIGSDILENS